MIERDYNLLVTKAHYCFVSSVNSPKDLFRRMDEIYSKIADDKEFGIDFDKNEKSQIKEFYRDETIFLTGCTGFLGKCIVEKLLRTCSGIKKLYLLVRPKKEEVSERIEKYFKDVVFSELRSISPNFESKVVFIEGHLKDEDLGIAANIRDNIINETTMIIHNASNVKFNEEMRKILRTNVYGTKYMLKLAEDCKNLKIFTYVSTAYSHSYQKMIEEKCYPPPGNLKLIKDLIDADESCPSSFTPDGKEEIIKPWPNLYTFSKASAESLVEEFAKRVSFRCLIWRPSIVLSTYKEPIPAWCDNANGPVAAVLGFGTGILYALHGGLYPSDLIPADMATNALLATMWDSVINRPEKNEVLVYNYGSSIVNQITARQMEAIVRPRGCELPPSKRAIRPYYFNGLTTCIYHYYFIHLFVHFIPALVIDMFFLLKRFQKPQYFALAIKVSKELPQIWFFLNGNWRFHIHETQKLWNRMSEIDKHLFYNDLNTFSWNDYGYNYYAGIRQWILKEPNDDKANRYWESLKIPLKLSKAVMPTVYLVLLYMAWCYFNSWFLFMLTPFINLIRLIVCTF